MSNFKEEIKEKINSAPETIESLFKNIYTIPVFQRPYKWGKEEIEEFIKDLFKSYEKNKIWFAGTIYLKESETIKSSLIKYNLIDGQQRITTIVLILMVYYVLNKENLELTEVLKEIEKMLKKEQHNLIENEGSEKRIFNILFENYKKYNAEDIKNIVTGNKIEEELKHNFCIIYDNIEAKIKNLNMEKRRNVFQFIKEKMILISIVVKIDYDEMFEIFDSINSKGKPLEEIDKIKSYIFRNLKKEDYSDYLIKWGNLIEKTEDNLDNYIYIFIKAYHRYYKETLSMKYFESFCEKELQNHYQKNILAENIKAFLDDLYNNVEQYRNLRNSKLPFKNNETQYYFEAINELSYQHPLPLIFRALCEYNKNKNKETLKNVIISSFKFMFTYQTIFDKDSKASQDVYVRLMPKIYGQEKLDSKLVKKEYINVLENERINKEKIKGEIEDRVAYSRKDTDVLLAFYQLTNDKKTTDYDMASWILKNKDKVQRDHILVQTPNDSDKKLKYRMYKDNEEKERLKLLEGNDFKKYVPTLESDMYYDEFKEKTLHKIGNLRLLSATANISKSNNTEGNMFTYKQVKERGRRIANFLVNKTTLFEI